MGKLSFHIQPAYLMCPVHRWMMPATQVPFEPLVFITSCGFTASYPDAESCEFTQERKFKLPEMELEEVLD